MSNARSPREVCSTTIGTSGLMVLASFACTPGFLPNVATARSRQFGWAGLLGTGCPQLPRTALLGFLAGRPQLPTCLRLLDADRLGLTDQQLARHLLRHVLAEVVEPATAPQLIHQL